MELKIENIIEAMVTQAVQGINNASKKTDRDMHVIPNSMEIDLAFTLELSAGGGVSFSVVKVDTEVKGTVVHRVKIGVYTSSETKDEVKKIRDEIRQLEEQYQR